MKGEKTIFSLHGIKKKKAAPHLGSRLCNPQRMDYFTMYREVTAPSLFTV